MTDISQPDGLECDHCGDVAIEFKPPRHPGDFWHLNDGDGGRCESCGFPGSVGINDGGYGEDNVAYWLTADYDEARCRRPDCEECLAAFDRAIEAAK